MPNARLGSFPGGALVEAGLNDLRAGSLSEESLLVLVASPRLRSLGFKIDDLDGSSSSYEHQLYEFLESRDPNWAYRRYNALIARMVSFTHAYEQFGFKHLDNEEDLLFSKRFREDPIARAFVRRVYRAFADDGNVIRFHSDDLIENETDRLQGKTWLEYALNPIDYPIYTSDHFFLNDSDLIYWLPALLIQATIGFPTSDEDLPSEVEDLVVPGRRQFRSTLKSNLHSPQRKAVIDYLKLRQIRNRKLSGRSPWENLDDFLRDYLTENCQELAQAEAYWKSP